MVWGKREAVDTAAAEFFCDRFDSDDIGDLKEYVGCKIEHNVEEGYIRFTQPVMLQSYQDEFKVSKDKERVTPADPGTVLVHSDENLQVNPEKHKYYRSGVGKLLHMMRWS